jgi:Lrp/AsnC family transcriptional regulator, regulator for asnA, asnC and gidA
MRQLIDEIDKKIVDALMENGRMSASDIARSIEGVSTRTVTRKIARLINKEVIKIKVVANRQLLGYTLLADLFIEVEPGKVTEVAEILCGMEEVCYVGIVTGESDISVQAQHCSIDDMQEFVLKKIHTIPGVRKTKTCLIMKILKLSYDWRIPEKLPERKEIIDPIYY